MENKYLFDLLSSQKNGFFALCFDHSVVCVCVLAGWPHPRGYPGDQTLYHL